MEYHFLAKKEKEGERGKGKKEKNIVTQSLHFFQASIKSSSRKKKKEV